MNLEKGINSLFIGGSFDDKGGKVSKIAHEVFKGVQLPEMDYYNGGYYQQLDSILNRIEDYQLIYWFPNIPNNKPKIVRQIKRKNKTCLLVTSKRNNGDYSTLDITHHALKNRSNLLVEFTGDERYKARIIDPLGNVFLDYSDDFDLVGRALSKRTDELLRYTRLPSTQVGENVEIPDETVFFDIVRKYAERFHELLHAKETTRFFGNASFRCECGFPSFKKDGLIYVSRRNVDKRELNKDGFVAVEQELPVRYYGEMKPSVDTPVQIKIYENYPNVRYMIHSHVFVKDAPVTASVIPCGAIEEFDEITKIIPDRESRDFTVNLKGHGAIAFAEKLDYLKEIDYLPREISVVHEDYSKCKR